MYREEYPRPNFIRTDWQSLNGLWEFESADSSPRNLSSYLFGEAYKEQIRVPFAPQSPLSGIGRDENFKSVWYRRTFDITAEQLKGLVILNFGAVDFRADVYINGSPVTAHRGGYTPFSVNITGYLKEGQNTLVVNALDDDSDPFTPSGKQGKNGFPHCTGIWQSVWLEFASKAYISAYRATPVISQNAVIAQGYIEGEAKGRIVAEVFLEGKQLGVYKYELKPRFFIKIPIEGSLTLWHPGEGRFYDIILRLVDDNGSPLDTVLTYAAFRSIELRDKAFVINGAPVTIKQITDSRFYTIGHYTAPSEAAIKQDLLCALASGFNSIRIQGTLPEPAYLYYADRLGLLIFQEYMSPFTTLNSHTSALWANEWREVIERDFGHPSVIAWLPVGGYNSKDAAFVNNLCSLTYASDQTRPLADGIPHFRTNFFDKRVSAKDSDAFLAKLHNPRNGGFSSDKEAAKARKSCPEMLPDAALAGLPLFASGITLPAEAYRDTASFKKHFAAYVNAVMSAGAAGFCFNSLFDTPEAANGFYTAERDFKLDRAAEPSIRRFLAQIK